MIVDDYCVAHQVLSRWTDGCYLHVGVSQLLSDDMLRLPDIFPPEMTCILQLGFIVIDPEIGRSGRSPPEDHVVVACEFQFCRKMATRVAVTERECERPFGCHRHS